MVIIVILHNDKRLIFPCIIKFELNLGHMSVPSAHNQTLFQAAQE